MTTKIIKFYRPELIGESNLVMRLHLPGRSAIVNGTGTSATIDAAGLITASVTEALTRALYAVTIYDSVAADFLWTPDVDSMLWMTGDAAGTYYVGSQALSEQVLAEAKNLEAVERSTTDTRAIEFEGFVSGQTFANSASTCTRLFPGESAASAEALSGAITLVRTGRYSIAYAVADRVQTGSTVIPTEVLYTLVDDLGNIGYLTLRVTSRLVTGPAVGVDVALTTVAGVIVGPLIIGDDYKEDDATRAFSFTITIPTGFVFAGSSCYLGFYKDASSNSITTGTITNNLDATLTMRFGLAKATTQDFACGNYQYSVELRDAAGIEVTHVHSKKRRIEFVSKFT